MSSHKQIFKSSSIVGGASIIEIIIGILKVKFVAVALGAAGIGLMGIYQNVLGIVTTIAGCGLNNSGVRQLATSSGDDALLTAIRRTLWWANIILGLAAMTLLWMFRDILAKILFDHTGYADELGWLGLGVFFSLVSISQTAVLQGLRRIGDLVRVKIIGAFFGAIVGVACVYLYGSAGIVGFVIVAPIASAVIAIIYTSRIQKMMVAYDYGELQNQWKLMLKLGVPLMGAGLLTLITQLIAKSLILQNLGIDSTGYFQAAWTISMVYMGFVLKAMATDYFPRLSEVISDHLLASRLVNEQAEMAQLLSAPVLLFMMAIAPWVIVLLYSDAFLPAVEMLRWQILGDILKVACWPMGFILMAAGRGGLFFAMQFCWNVIYLLVLAIGLSEMGLVIAGVAFLVAYVVQFLLLYRVAGYLIDFKVQKNNIVFMLIVVLAGAIIGFLSLYGDVALFFGVVLSFLVTYYSLSRLQELVDWKGSLKRKFH